uniref:Uncharacterized protein n=1 Tax=Sulfolobus neozealandicus TaxID=299422 RepID=Q5DVF4_9CREN|nr:hypothetical protein [Sulfolobus neozealandicus]
MVTVVVSSLSANMFEYQYKFCLPVHKIREESEFRAFAKDEGVISYIGDEDTNSFLMEYFREFEVVQDSEYQYNPADTVVVVSPKHRASKVKVEKFEDLSVMIVYPARYEC